MIDHPHIYSWVNFHTFGGVFIRPHGSAPDTDMHPFDLAVFREVGKLADDHVGYPMVSGFEEFTYEPNKPLYGDITDYAYHQRGTLAYVCELWDLFAQLEMPRPSKFVHYYGAMTRSTFEAIKLVLEGIEIP